MEYRKLPHGNERISVIGIGSSALGSAEENEIEKTISAAIEAGINYFDMASASARPFAPYGRVLRECRSMVYLQVHFGANYETGEYGWTTDLDTVKRSIEWQLHQLQTDYIDFGFIHCIDSDEDLKKYVDNGILDYLKQMKDAGIVHHIGLSSHTPSVTNKILDMGIVDMLMFSINPGYDYSRGEFAFGSAAERMSLYRRCEAEGVGISVMKPFSAGQLLDAKVSPFKHALTRYQCLQYALDKPGVVTALPGVRGIDDLNDILGFCNATAEERDYSIIGTFAPREVEGVCVYCNHCQPCPTKLDIALINKYYDLAKIGDELAKEHYLSLEHHASECLGCGHCSARCPFEVNQYQRMMEISEYFGV